MTFRNKLVVALIPARGGSKGVKRKNLRIVAGKPLLAHTIHAACDSVMIDRVYVSSDDDDILRLAKEMGVDIIERDAEAAKDSATASDVLNDFLEKLPKTLVAANPYIIFLQPTSPLRKGAHIDAAFDLMLSAQGDMCISVTELKKTPFKSFTLTAEGRLQSLFDESLTNANRQSLPAVYYPNGAIYIFRVAEFFNRSVFPSNGALPYIMSESESIDIDTEDDLALVEKLCYPN